MTKVGKTGIRERSKLERQKKIMTAARELFLTNGYEAATLRQISASAGLGFGTVFNYVSNKRDLIFLIFNDEMDSLTDVALAAPRASQDFFHKILSITEPHYRLFAKDPILSRILLNEIMVPAEGYHFEKCVEIRSRLIRGIEHLVAEAQNSGEISRLEDSETVARLIFFTFAFSLRWWLTFPKPHWAAGQKEFARLLRLQIVGLSRGRAPARSATRTVAAGSQKRLSRGRALSL